MIKGWRPWTLRHNSGPIAILWPCRFEVDDALVDQITDVLDVLDSEAATTLLRGYYNAQTSVSDLQFEVDDAIRYWLAQSELSDPDTVINITGDNE